MNTLPMDMDICPPLPLADTDPRPVEITRITRAELCRLAEIPMCVTGGSYAEIVLHVGRDHFRSPDVLYLGLGGGWVADWKHALRALEVLAHGFHDYAARECVCHKGLFTVPVRRGRPPVAGRAKTAAERMRAMRRRKAAANELGPSAPGTSST